jgi:hypothetical protein
MNQAVKLAVSIEPKSFIALLTSKNEAYQAIKHALPKQQESIARVLGVLQVEHLLTVRTEEIDLQTAGDLGMGLLLKSRQ